MFSFLPVSRWPQAGAQQSPVGTLALSPLLAPATPWRKEGGNFRALGQDQSPAWFLLSMGCGFISIQRGVARQDRQAWEEQWHLKEKMDVWEPLNAVRAPGGEFAKPMEGRGTVSTAFNTGTFISLPFPSPRCSEASTHRSISCCVAVLGLSSALVPCHIVGCFPAPGPAASGASREAGLGGRAPSQ